MILLDRPTIAAIYTHVSFQYHQSKQIPTPTPADSLFGKNTIHLPNDHVDHHGQTFLSANILTYIITTRYTTSTNICNNICRFVVM